MLRLRLAFVSGLTVLSGSVAAEPILAQVADDSKVELVNLYTMSVAIDTCDDVDLTAADEDKLDKAISAAEGKLALTEEASEALYTRLSAIADNDKDAFCREVVPKLKDAIGKLSD